MTQPQGYSITVTHADLHRHYFQVTLELDPGPGADTLDLQMAAWTPGSYLIRNFARHVEDFQATVGGRPVVWRKLDRETWRLEVSGGRELRVTYRVYAFDESVRGALLDDRVGVWNGACLYMRPRGWEDRPARLRVQLPEGWIGVYTSLAETPDGDFTAASWDELLDSPVMTGVDLHVHHFQAGERPHVLVLDGESTADETQLVRDLQRVVAAATRVYDTVPYDRYVWLLHLTEASWGGLEHCASSYNAVPATAFHPEKPYRLRVLRLLAHEFFHLWNGKRLRPVELGPFDYQREVHTTMLWLAEGVTSYLDLLILLRASLISTTEYLEEVGTRLTNLARVPGRLQDSVESASWDAWIKLYIPDENSGNRSVSYYLKGSVAAMALDLDLLARTGGEQGLAHVLRNLYHAYHEGEGRGITTAEFRAACEQVAGGDVTVHFDQHLGRPGDIDLAPYLEPFGLALEQGVDRGKVPSGEELGGFLGASLKDQIDRGVVVERVPRDSPAAAGLAAGDEILALDGYRVRTAEALATRLRGLEVGTRARFTVTRRGLLREVPITLGEHPQDRHRLRHVEAPTADQRRLYEVMMGEPWPRTDG
jgi:predicted metalloprotease with PDZ domain